MAVNFIAQTHILPHPPHPPHPPQPLASLLYNPNHAALLWIRNPYVEPPRPLHLLQRLKTFHLFPCLPIELRLRIWAFASGEARIVEIRTFGDTLRNEYTPIKFSVSPNYTHPITLRICQESRREALRLYKHIRIGISATVLLPGKQYLPWEYHPAFSGGVLRVQRAFRRPVMPQWPLALPRKPVDVYLNFDLDTIYLGPEFRPQHLERFLTAVNAGYELDGLKYLAMDRKLWVFAENGHSEYLGRSLYALRSRPLRELYMIPDDEKNFLQDKYYYQKHAIDFVEPAWLYKFRPAGEEECVKSVVEELNDSFQEMWKQEGKENPPIVKVMSVRRNKEHRRYRDPGFKAGMAEIQLAVEDMRLWTWIPASEAS